MAAQYTSIPSLVTKMKEMMNRDEICIRALERIYSFQTTDEQIDGETQVLNDVGFTGVDAPILTSLYDFYHEKKYLTPKQMILLHKKMPKYALQLIHNSIAEGLIHKEGRYYIW